MNNVRNHLLLVSLERRNSVYILSSVLGQSGKSVKSKYGHGANVTVRQSYIDKVQFDVVASTQLIKQQNHFQEQGQ